MVAPEYEPARLTMKDVMMDWLAGALSSSETPLTLQNTWYTRIPELYYSCVDSAQALDMTSKTRSTSGSGEEWRLWTLGEGFHSLSWSLARQ